MGSMTRPGPETKQAGSLDPAKRADGVRARQMRRAIERQDRAAPDLEMPPGAAPPRHRRSTPLRAGALAALALLSGCVAAAPVPAVSAPHSIPVPERRAATLDAAARAHPTAFLDRIGWGADAAELRQLQRLGATRFLERQLNPHAQADMPAPIAQALSQLPVRAPLETWMPRLVVAERRLRRNRRGSRGTQADAQTFQRELKALHRRMNALTREAMDDELLRAVYGRDPLRQRLIWFWVNHFNVFRGGNIGPMMDDYVRRVIAPHALGHFRSLLQATMFSPQMLLYLNNAENHRGHINENYAREVMELHTVGLGADYTQRDVTDLAHVLTGLGVDLIDRPVRVRPALRGWLWQRGLVVFNPARHDPQPERVMGHTFSGQGVGEIEQVITLLADDPATARHISLELAQYFCADQPSPALIAAMVRTWQRTDGDIRAVMRTLLTSREFSASLAHPQFKDPMRYLISAVRASVTGRIITHPQPLIGILYRLGEPLYGRKTPDGYPLDADAWSSPGQLTVRFALAQQLAAGAPALFRSGDRGSRARPATPATVTGSWRVSPPDLEHSAVFVASEPTLSRATRTALAQTRRRVRWNALWLSSPEFMTE